eukprot:2145903-Rhodomonas_salina.1
MRCPVLLCGVWYCDLVHGAICLRTCCAISISVRRFISSTQIAYGATSLRACYAMSSTEIAYGATSRCQITCRASRLSAQCWAKRRRRKGERKRTKERRREGRTWR